METFILSVIEAGGPERHVTGRVLYHRHITIYLDMTPGPLTALRSAVKKGGIRLLVLNALSGRAMHGYEIAATISRLSGGIYAPSAGSIYPGLQRLEERGFVQGVEADGRKVYHLTDQGAAFLSEHDQDVHSAIEAIRGRGDPASAPILRSATHLQKTIAMYLPEMSMSRRLQVAAVLDEATVRIVELMK